MRKGHFLLTCAMLPVIAVSGQNNHEQLYQLTITLKNAPADSAYLRYAPVGAVAGAAPVSRGKAVLYYKCQDEKLGYISLGKHIVFRLILPTHSFRLNADCRDVFHSIRFEGSMSNSDLYGMLRDMEVAGIKNHAVQDSMTFFSADPVRYAYYK